MVGRRVSSAQTTPQEAFWAWFVQNTEFLTQFVANREPVLDEIERRLHDVHEGLTFEIGQAADGIYDFIISADGIRDLFPEVISLARAAPWIEGWRIISFRPRMPDMYERTLEYQGITLTYGDFWYELEKQGEPVGLKLFIRGLNEENRTTMRAATYLMLDAALGEYDVETKIGSIELKALPEDPAAMGLKPFKDLTAEVDRRFPSTAH